MNAFCTMQGWLSVLPGNLEAVFLPLLDEGRGSSVVLLRFGLEGSGSPETCGMVAGWQGQSQAGFSLTA